MSAEWILHSTGVPSILARPTLTLCLGHPNLSPSRHQITQTQKEILEMAVAQVYGLQDVQGIYFASNAASSMHLATRLMAKVRLSVKSIVEDYEAQLRATNGYDNDSQTTFATLAPRDASAAKIARAAMKDPVLVVGKKSGLR
ncbi:hypothetical protein H4Q26_014060 [Puccinia striiformis f. sp. tritici PST-130]|nr:hypothetical protein H4Q26_014060 [Puccinia striiformis f. sp. tritici PST-130]